VHPDDLCEASIVYSFGIGEDISFDKAVIEKHKCPVFAFDPTPKSIDWIERQSLPPNFTFFGYGLDGRTGFVNFNLPKNKNYVSGSIIKHQSVDANDRVLVPMKCFSDITAELGHNQINISKIDIEGSEYEIMDTILSCPVRIDQILVEIHERFFSDGRLRTSRLLSTLKNHGYALFAVSDSLQELSFINVKNRL
jgi:FkbM family methyltransferase